MFKQVNWEKIETRQMNINYSYYDNILKGQIQDQKIPQFSEIT